MKKLYTIMSIAITLSLLCVSSGFAQGSRITGKVVDDAGVDLPGVNVLVKGTTMGVATDMQGAYQIELPADNTNTVLVFSFIGFAPQEVAVNGQSTINVTLASDVAALSEVIVVGYGQTQNKQTVSNAINTIDTKVLEARPVYRVEQALQGAAPGVTIVQNSGSPGAPLTIRLRGTGTSGAAQPLFIVDGMQVPDLNYLNSADIENISILKDAAASAIYGARGGNGVILVQTKKGRRNTNGKPEVSLDGYTGFQNLRHQPNVMNRDQYVNYYNDYANKNGGTPISDADRAKLPNTNWYDEVFDKNVPMHNLNLSVANGGDKYSYFLSGGNFDQRGLVGGSDGKSRYKRNNLKFNFEADVLKNLTVKIGADLVRTERNYLFENQAGTGVAIMNYLSSIPAIYPAYDPTDHTIPFNPGDLNNPILVNGVQLPAVGAVTNPLLALQLNNNKTVSDIKVFNGAATWKPMKNLDINTSYAYYQDLSTDKNFYPQFDYRPKQNFYNETADLTLTNYKSSYSQWEGNARYKVTTATQHSFEVLAGFSVLKSAASTTSQSGSDFFVNSFDKINFALIKDPTKIVNAKPGAFETGLLSFYGRVNYNFKEKYLFAATLRSDASSKFSKSNRTGVFPSVSAGWVLSEENFLSNIAAINLFKIRASWGINGNNFINNYQYSTIVDPYSGPSFDGQNSAGISVPYLANPNVKWEQVAQTDIGLDVNLFNNTLGLTFDYYDKRTSDMLLPLGTPSYTGYNSAAANVANVKNSGVEVLLSYRKTYGDFSWNASFNLGYNKNQVTSLGLNGQPISGGTIGFIFPDAISRTDVGHSISSFYGYKVEKLDENGNLVFKDLDGKAGITDKDKTFIGSPFPDFTYGATLGASYKGFDISGFLYGSHGNKIYDATVRLDASYANRPVSYGDVDAPKNILGGESGGSQTQVSDFYVKNGSFAKLKTLSLGYTLPASLLKSIALSKVRFYVTGQNLFVITKYTGIDPEIGQSAAQNTLDVGIDRGFYPQPKTIMVGFSAKF